MARKSAKVRQRESRARRAEEAAAVAPHRVVPVPPVSKRRGASGWHPGARAWWQEMASSSQAARYLPVDWAHIKMILRLVDRFYRAEDVGDVREARLLAGSIHSQMKDFGGSARARQLAGWGNLPPPAPDSVPDGEKGRDSVEKDAKPVGNVVDMAQFAGIHRKSG